MPPNFIFPPPPPPPPPVSASNVVGHRQEQRGGQRQSRGRGRGGGAHSYRGNGSRPRVDWDRPTRQHGWSTRSDNQDRSVRASYPSNQKRTHGQAFTPKNKSVPLGKAPPAVPSFGAPLPVVFTPSTNDASTMSSKPKKDRTFNQLGLTPRKEEHESSEEEDDEDEEAKLGAASHQIGRGALRFEHKGQLMTLSTSEDIQAWIAERKKRYPTRARIAEAVTAKTKLKQQRADDLNKDSQQKKPRNPPMRQTEKVAGLNIQKVRTGGKHHEDSRFKANIKTSSSTRWHNAPNTDRSFDANTNNSDDSPMEPLSQSEETSSSGTSEDTDDSDEAPTEQSAKVPVGALSPSPSNTQRSQRDDIICPRLRKTERCRVRGCSYQHPDPHRTSKSARSAAGERDCPRIPLHQRLLARQHNEDDQEILRCIIAIGERGLFNVNR